MRLDGKVAVVTGGTEGLGLATAQLFQDEGAHVVICGRRQEKLNEAAALLGDGCLAVQCDISRIPDLDRLYAATRERFGKVDVLVANASILKAMPISQVTEEFFDETLNVNLKGTYFTVQRALDHLNDGASIVLVSSVSHYLDVGEVFSVYTLTKAAIRQMARAFANALVGRGIRVNTLHPGPHRHAHLHQDRCTGPRPNRRGRRGGSRAAGALGLPRGGRADCAVPRLGRLLVRDRHRPHRRRRPHSVPPAAAAVGSAGE